ncbi:MAG: glycosyltransferase, partial [Acetobacteraceae bacterium]|nr:glycosyltransferase [Acetobacteraceae bacterium]
MSTEPETLEQARREIERLRAAAAANAESARLQAMRAAALERDVRNRRLQVDTIRSSTSWRLTLPLRLAGRGPGWAKRAAEIVAREGLGGISERLRVRLRERRQLRLMRPRPTDRAGVYEAAASPAAAVVAPRVLIVADLLLPQCAKYRVWQKQAHFERIGTACTVVDWRDHARAWSALQTHALAIFYRVPGKPKPLELIAEAKRLGLVTYWEADDLIFDMGHYLANRNLDTLEPKLRESVLSGVELFRKAMLACDRTIASTASLAERMREAGAGPSAVVENALDERTLEAAAGAPPRRRDGEVVIVYGSGSKAHDKDFAEAAPALAAVLRDRPQVRLRVIGDLTLPESLAAFAARIERLPGTDYSAYLGLLAAADISLAPLEPSAFNDAKSNIKFIEAAIVGLPSVCSPRASFRDVVRAGETGFLAEGEAAWQDALLALVDDEALRHRVGAAARAFVLDRYAPEAVARREAAPLVAGLDRRTRPPLRVLVVNIYFAPVTFGGATIVAEEMVRRLNARTDTEVYVFTSQDGRGEPYTLRRYEWEGVPVLGVKPSEADSVNEFDNPAIAALFADTLRAFQPDVVHFHAVQVLGAGLLRACDEAGVPYAVTVHDAWWLCGRQFMVKEDGSYCFQTRIDPSVCEACMPEAPHLRPRLKLLLQALSGAALVLSPSEAHRQLYLANGLEPTRVRVNHNGIRLAERPRCRP